MDYTNKVVIVTGASSGIGAAAAVLFAKYGAKLTLVGRNQQRLHDVCVKCEGERGNKPLELRLDLTDKGSCATVITKTIGTFGKIDVLVNNAGMLTMSSIFDEHIDAFDDIINLNLKVPYKLTHLAIPYLTKTKGNIVNLVGARYTRIRHGFIPFSIAKAGLDRFTKSAAVELALQGVRINSVQPGVVRSNLLRNMVAGDGDPDMDGLYEILSDHNYNIIEPEEVAKMVVFVASDLCPNVNGADFGVHGASVLT